MFAFDLLSFFLILFFNQQLSEVQNESATDPKKRMEFPFIFYFIFLFFLGNNKEKKRKH